MKGLSLLGDTSTLDGVDVGAVSLDFNVMLEAGILGNAYDNPVLPRTVAMFDSEVSVVKGQVLVHPDGTFKVDFKADTNPYAKRFVVTPYTP